MSIWNEVDTSKVSGTFEVDGGSNPLPDNTVALAYIKDALWKEYEGEQYINLTWSVLKPEEYKGRVVFQKIKVNEIDSKKCERAIMMLYAIDANTGGGLPKDSNPTDMDLARCLTKKPMVINVKTWKMGDKTGNWINKVSPKKATTQVDIPVDNTPAPVQAAPVADDDDDDIPF